MTALIPPPDGGLQLIRNWAHRYFSSPQVIALAVVLVALVVIVVFTGDMVAPVIASLVIAYLLEGLVAAFEARGVTRLAAVILVFSAFVAFLLFSVSYLLPVLVQQAVQLIQLLPSMIHKGQIAILTLPERFPELEKEIVDATAQIRREALAFGQLLVSHSLSSVFGFITIAVYLVLMPLMVFFFMKDKDRITTWTMEFLPKDRRMLNRVWYDIDKQLGNYVRGKFIEILIVGIATYVTFSLMGLQFAMLLGIGVGISVLIPYIGAVAVTIPVALVGYFQWGFSPDFAWLMIAYTIIQGLDGNVVVPLLFSEAVNLHPIAIIAAILIFGGLWGFWGIFFAIPLATVVQAVLKALPRFQTGETHEHQNETHTAEVA